MWRAQQARKQKAYEDRIKWQAEQKRLALDSLSKRAAALKCARVVWRDKAKISAIYDEARRKTTETGVMHHVDHYYPLQGTYCSGLHVHENLRVLEGSLNCGKSNSMPFENSPALLIWVEEERAKKASA